ncbi:rRNA maturation RNase YbeY [Candidatus Woesebacteria bacterium]|nr:rRNA maturation RNase YbeY [Candidatus Woesebacteria bacterium]
MIKVNVKKQSNYPISSTKIRSTLKNFLAGHGIVSDAEVSVALVGRKRMLEVGKKYLKDKSLHGLLSFTQDEVDPKFIYPPDGVIHLGEIIICYAKAFEEAKNENKLIEEKVVELIEHGALHLLGIHHD